LSRNPYNILDNSKKMRVRVRVCVCVCV
jgi:hypothetical protein